MLVYSIVWCAVGAADLQNGGFEDPDLYASWKPHVYKETGDPGIRVDTHVLHEGKQSLCIEARDPCDVALGQFLDLPPGSVWRVRCWIKTEDLVPRDRTNVTGLIDIQQKDGPSLARTPARTGTSDWKEAEAVFRVPALGTVNVALFFVGFGKGTGKVWFDDVRLEEIPMERPETAAIALDKRGKRPIDGKQCGQFIEPLCNLIPSMTAQQVDNTSFEDEPPYRVAYKAEIDKPHRPWYPDGAVHMAKYAFDAERPFNGKRSLQIECGQPRRRAGISQDGFYLAEGTAYRLRLHMRGTGNVPVWASLHGGGAMIAGPLSLGPADAEWRPAEAELHATRTIENATLTLEFQGPGTLRLDRVYLIGEDAVLGLWRPDVVEVLKAMRPGVIRWGGSAVNEYEWDQCIGPWDTRTPFTTCWGGLEPNFVGMEEFVRLCRHIGAEPLLCIRWHGKKPEDAAAQVEYFNGGPKTPWGKRRAENGHPDPYGVTYWQIGNEVGGKEYDASVKAFAEAMKRVDPRIKVLSSYPSDEILERGEGYLDYLCPHHYGCADLAGKENEFRWLQDLIARHGQGRDIRVAVTEWNTTAGDWGLGRGTLQTLSNALQCARYHNLLQRYADLVEIAVRSNLVDSFGSGVILTGPGWLYCAPTYYAQQLYTRAAGSHPLVLERSSTLPSAVQDVDINAALSEDGKTLRIYAVNVAMNPAEVKFRIAESGHRVAGGAAHVLKDRDAALCPEVMNTRDDPNRIVPVTRPLEISGGEFVFSFEPLTLTLLEVEMKP
jgi:alpha-N-arabinofuranosidase